jgi:hypothetical protein
MKTKTSLSKILKLSIVAIALSLTACPSMKTSAVKADADTWSGAYRMEPLALSNAKANADNKKNVPIANMHITKLADAIAENEPARYRADLTRWTMTADNGDRAHPTLRRFVTDERGEYKEMKLQEMYEAKKIECLSGEVFMLCRTSPNTTVDFGGFNLTTKSGIFGAVYMHTTAIFELYKLDAK